MDLSKYRSSSVSHSTKYDSIHKENYREINRFLAFAGNFGEYIDGVYQFPPPDEKKKEPVDKASYTETHA